VGFPHDKAVGQGDAATPCVREAKPPCWRVKASLLRRQRHVLEDMQLIDIYII